MSIQPETVAGSLRDLADFLDAHPAIDARGGLSLNLFVEVGDLARFARMASWRKEYVASWFCLTKDFGNGVRIEINTEREKVCRKVITGMRLVPAEPAREAVPEHEEPVEEWICDETSILAQP